ncbi:SDR family NAD(P)-dependent oxidoreductase [Streptomyces sp. NPDC053079]|uniref:SDR family NAD(P)-dependent oxidoreductase n=1 Tax=Streptomyces sp. NPDC053079 TaxID=3365697 RepID=UPI0037D77CD7
MVDAGLSNALSGEAIAVVGAACRLPGGIADPQGLWSALAEGRDLISAGPPAGRFDAARFWDPDPERQGKSYTFAGGYLDDIAGFDAAYFGMSPREAKHLDPQQRLLLELTTEAFDDAAVDPRTLAGSDTAVLVGVSDMSYGGLQMTRLEEVGAHTMSGSALSITANRLSRTFDLRGPSMAVDTACSSSLVALHQACEILRSRRSAAAVVGGVNLLLGPQAFIGFSRAMMLSPRGRCATFSAEADGYVRSEGGAVVLLKPLADALAAGDRVHAVIVASGVNCDGLTPGLAVPSAQAQQALLEEVYGRAGIAADDLLYVEAHGTGTPVGDPPECEAIGRALGMRRTRGPLPIGSVKTNLGHGEPASGLTGLLKAVLVLRHGHVPASLHAEPPNPAIDFRALNLDPATEAKPVAGRLPGFVGVNSFGFGGANAHAVLAGPPPPQAAGERPDGPLPVLVSARTPQALGEATAALAAHLAAADEDDFPDLCWTATRRRARHTHRLAVLADSAHDAARRLAELAADEGALRAAGTPPAGEGAVAFAFCGNGSQWDGMAADLMAGAPAFRTAVEEADAHLTPLLGWSVAELLARPAPRDGEQPHRPMSDTRYAQPALFALQLGLAAQLAAHHVRPDAVLGHSSGELAAAHLCGALDLAAAAPAVAGRSQAQAATAGQGRMAVVALGEEQASRALAPFRGRLEIAAVNSSQDVTVSGDTPALRALCRTLTERNVPFQELDIDHPFHSAAMDAIEEPLRRSVTGLAPAAPRIPMYSTVTGRPVGPGELDTDYWWRNVRHPVRFADAVRALAADGLAAVVEIGPRPVLRGALSRLAAEGPHAPFPVTPAMTPDVPGAEGVRRAAARLLAAGPRRPHDGTDPWFPAPGRVRALPAYPWQREHHWHGTPEHWVRTSGDGVLVHPLLGERLPALEPVWHATVERTRTPWLGDHDIAGAVVMPAVGYVEMALAAGREVFDAPVELDTIDIPRGLPLPWDAAMDIRLQTSLSDEDGIWRVASRTGDTGSWRLHARGRARRLATTAPPPDADLTQLREHAPERRDIQWLYDTAARVGLRYGPAFRVLRDLHVGDGDVLASYHCTPPDDGYGGYVVFPPLLDGAWHACVALMTDADTIYLPAAIGRVRVWRTVAPTGWVHLRLRSRTRREAVWNITIMDEEGAVAVEMDECRLQRIEIKGIDDLGQYATVLRAAPLPGRPVAPSPLPAPATVLSKARPEIDAVTAPFLHERYARQLRDAQALTAEGAIEAFCGLLPEPAAMFDDAVPAVVEPRFRAPFALLLEMGERHGVLCRRERAWHIRDAEERARAIREQILSAPDQLATSVLLLRTTYSLHDVVRGRRDPMESLFLDSGPELIGQFYDIDLVNRLHNRIARALLRQLVAVWPADRALRVLEVGAGTGGLTAWLLPLLPADRTQYAFTDVSPAYFPAAQARFADYDFVDYRTLDLDVSPLAQGFTPESFDVIVAGYSLHAAKDVGRCLRHLASLTARDGHLIAVETHAPEVLVGIFGMLDSFWQTDDTHLRPGSVLLPRHQWPPLLAEHGFGDVVQTGTDRSPLREQFSVLLARRRGAGPERSEEERRPQSTGEPAASGTAVEPAPDPIPSSWVLITEDDSEEAMVRALAARLAAAGSPHVRTLSADAVHHDGDDFRADGTGPTGVVHLLSARSDHAADGYPHLAVDLAVRRLAVLRAIARAHRAQGTDPALRTLVLVCHPTGALPAPERPAVPGQAAAWGAARSLAAELPSLAVKRVSFDRGTAPDADAGRLLDELPPATGTDEDEVVLTAAGRFVPRVVHAPHPRAPRTADDGSGSSHRLVVDRPGLGYRLTWDERPTPVPGEGEVVVSVRAAALNYRDIMVATGLLPPAADESIASEGHIGLEGAGVITAVGPGVTGLTAGDRVFGLMDAYAGHAHTLASLVRPIPTGMTFTEAATVPVAFLTVQHSLEELTRLRPGETLLVHGGAGGVGLAALQYAQDLGAQVIATAGSPAKRDLLTALGVDHVLDSRSLSFADRIRELTAGRGVDVVLNSLSGEAAARSMEVLAHGGRFVELGKRDLYANSRTLLRPLAGNASLHVVDLARMTFADPEAVSAALETVAERLRAGRYRPLLHQAYPAHRAEEAFRLLQHSRHIGKVLLSFDEPVPVRTFPAPTPVDPDGTYLVVGGLSGLGARTALHLAERGARHLALVGRRGVDTPEAPEVLARLAAREASVSVHAADVTDADAMRTLLRRIDATGHPLRGIVHAALHLEDEALADLDDERLRAVLAPKMAGAMILDQLTRHRNTSLTLYSSLTAWTGNIKQTNYAAANLFLEALTRRRRHDGEPGLAVAWGAIAETGYVAREGLTSSLAAAGLTPVTPHEACTALDRFHAHGTDVTAYGRCDWARMAMIAPSLAGPRFAAVVPPPLIGTDYRLEELLARLAAASPEEALDLLEKALTSVIADILHMPADQLDPTGNLRDYGMDSLMAMELLATLRKQFQCDLPIMQLLHSDGSVRGISEILLPRLTARPSGEAPRPLQSYVSADAVREA